MSEAVAVGIDVSKATLDVVIHPTGESWQVPNTPGGWQRLIAVITPFHPDWIVCEATSKLHLGLTVALTDAGLIPSVVNPSAVKHFRKAIGKHSKTDIGDAALLAHYGSAIKPVRRPAPAEHIRALQELLTRHYQLTQDATREQIRKESAAPALHASIDAHIAFIAEQLKQVDHQIDLLLARDDTLTARRTVTRTVPGIGRHISAVLTIALPELGAATHKELAALVGVAPFNRDSGGGHGLRYTYGGRAPVRTALYQAVNSALRHDNVVIRAFYTRLRAKGKPHKVAMVACMNKLLGILNAMHRDGIVWQETTAVQQVRTA